MKQGQTSIMAFMSVAFVGLAFILLWPVASAFFTSMAGGDSFVDMLLTLVPIFIIISGIVAFFVYQAVVSGQ
jgi:hypothetical protein